MLNIEKIEEELNDRYKEIEEVAYINQRKVLNAFQTNKVSSSHFSGTNGYGYGDIGRETLSKVFCSIFNCEKSIVTPHLTCGTHAISCVFLGILRPNDTFLSITGDLYDSIDPLFGEKSNLIDYNIRKEIIGLKDNNFDREKILDYLKTHSPKIIHIQRSRGYSLRNALSIDQIKEIISSIRELNKTAIITVDNCYCEFVETREPTDVGADIVVGSLIKNPGGGLAPTGAYICGTTHAVNLVAGRVFTPTLLDETGSYAYGYRLFYQGVFMAPHTVMQALKSAYLIGECMHTLGFEVFTDSKSRSYDIVKAVKFNTKEELINFVQIFQKYSPIDSFAIPMPEPMAGYESDIIMAAGTFVAGASIELSCDAPIRAPYIAYMQGGLTYEHAKIIASELLKSYS